MVKATLFIFPKNSRNSCKKARDLHKFYGVAQSLLPLIKKLIDGNQGQRQVLDQFDQEKPGDR